MKKILFISLMFLMVCGVTGCDSKNIYENEKYGFTLEYPKQWNVFDEYYDEKRDMFTLHFKPENDANYFFILQIADQNYFPDREEEVFGGDCVERIVYKENNNLVYQFSFPVNQENLNFVDPIVNYDLSNQVVNSLFFK